MNATAPHQPLHVSPPPPPEPAAVVFFNKFPPDVKAEFKATCAKSKITMKEAVIRFYRHAGAVLPELARAEFRRLNPEAKKTPRAHRLS